VMKSSWVASMSNSEEQQKGELILDCCQLIQLTRDQESELCLWMRQKITAVARAVSLWIYMSSICGVSYLRSIRTAATTSPVRRRFLQTWKQKYRVTS